MAFVGQFRPSQHLALSRGRVAPDLLVYSAGCFVGAGVSFYLLARIGQALAPVTSNGFRVALAGILATGLIVLDVKTKARTCSVGLRRQTPKGAATGPIGVFLWGIDTGNPFTTFRATALPFLAVVMVSLGDVESGLLGFAYAGGFLAVLWFTCTLPLRGRQEPSNDSNRILKSLVTTRPIMRRVAIGIGAVAAVSMVAIA